MCRTEDFKYSHTRAGKGKAKKKQDKARIIDCAPTRGAAVLPLYIEEEDEDEELNNQPSAPSAEVGPLVIAKMLPKPNFRSLPVGKCARNITRHTEVERNDVA